MARTVTLTSLLAQVRQCADIENSTSRFPDADLTEYINGSYAELYDLLIISGGDYNLTSATIAVTNGTSTYALASYASDFYKLRGVDVDVGGPGPLPMRPYAFEERNFYLYNTGWSYGRPIAYRLTGTNIKFIPTPTGSYTVTLWYHQAPTRLVSGSDTFDGVSGWEEYVVVDAAIKCLRKDDRDPSVLMAQKSALLKRITDMASSRDAGAPEKVGDVENPNIGLWWR